MFPLGAALLPGEQLPLRIFEPRYRQMLRDCLSGDGTPTSGFGVVLIARGREVGGGDVRHDVGTFADIDTVVTESDGQAQLSCTGGWRFRVIEWLPDAPYPHALIRPLPEPAVDDASVQHLVDIGTRIRALVDASLQARGLEIDDDDVPRFDAADLAAVGIFGWAARLPIGPADRQDLLEADDWSARCHVFDEAVTTLEARIRFGA
ncbi:LON peptidase substrate-binding domain-containing protein [Gordonia sp. DT30]|uniref:LON peptidase substrate-binding domain-containing protein n=1 Tax=unclassified Gordonia (in: high G+C Gram-positive bacteria) TaxID=2657482 RepID=UPI003CEB49E4